MSHCGPATANLSFAGACSLLRICTPLLPFPPLSRTWNDSSKSRYSRLLHRNVLNFSPSGSVLPTRAPSLTLQYCVSPSQPVRSLPLKKSAAPSAVRAGWPAASSRAATRSRVRVAYRTVVVLLYIGPPGDDPGARDGSDGGGEADAGTGAPASLGVGGGVGVLPAGVGAHSSSCDHSRAPARRCRPD